MPNDAKNPEPPSSLPAPTTFSTVEVDARLLEVLIAEEHVLRRRPLQAGQAQQAVRQAVELAAAAHQKAGATAAQLRALEEAREKLLRLAGM
jgi:hypothetical protein